jgi:hypothetical protein
MHSAPRAILNAAMGVGEHKHSSLKHSSLKPARRCSRAETHIGVPTMLPLLSMQVGRDSRLSSPLISASMVAGVASSGVAATSFGLCTTPAMFMSCILPGEKGGGSALQLNDVCQKVVGW